MNKPQPESAPDCLVCGSAASYVGTKSEYRFHRCPTCGLLFVWPLPTENLTIYSEDYFAGAQGGFGYVDYDRDKSAMADTF